MKENELPFSEMAALVADLRGEKGCPWDRKQTPDSMRVYLTEETYELLEALEKGEPADVCEELGDVLFQVFFLARMFEEKGAFDIGDVARRNITKMVGRHPHVFGDVSVNSADEVRQRWHEFKQGEKSSKKIKEKGALSSVPRNLPALMRAYRVWERATRVGFDTSGKQALFESLEKKWHTLSTAAKTDDPDLLESAMGDFLFGLTTFARKARVHPESALSKAVNGFIQSFHEMECRVEEMDTSLEETPENEQKKLFDQIHQQTK